MPDTETPPPDSDERRRFLRVDDQLLFRVRRRDIAEDPGADAGPAAVGIDQLMMELDRQVAVAIASLEPVAPQTAGVLHALDQKIGAVGRMVTGEGRLLLQEPLRTVNLSASGMAFTHPEPLAVGAELELQMALLPEFTFFSPRARVVDSQPTDDRGGYLVAVEFQDLDEAECDLLVRHVFRRHSEELRAAATEG